MDKNKKHDSHYCQSVIFSIHEKRVLVSFISLDLVNMFSHFSVPLTGESGSQIISPGGLGVEY